jgi:hypothetical protein
VLHCLSALTASACWVCSQRLQSCSRLPTICPATLSQWKYRGCGFDRYHRVGVLRKTGARCERPFLACSRCSVMFLNANASQFDANGTANPNVEAPPAVVTPMRRLHSQSRPTLKASGA